MKKIILKSLKIRNFKGVKSMDVDFSDGVTSIYGGNATGKTTIADAFFWLLFDKDSVGRADFNIKPLSPSGEIADHAAVTSVEGVIEIDGVDVMYKKTLREKWSRRRGSENTVFDGNETERFINGLPMKKYEYDESVTGIASEEVFRAVTSVTYFSKILSKNDRRRLLFEMSSIITDRELIAGNEKLLHLLPLLDKYGDIDGIKLAAAHDRKRLNKAREDIPVRIDELRLRAEALAGIDFDETQKQYVVIKKQAEAAKEKVASVKNFSYPNELANELKGLEMDLKALYLENKEYRAQQVSPQNTEALKSNIMSERQRIASLNEAGEHIENEMKRLRADFERISSEPLNIEESCPTCGRAYDAQSVEAAKNSLRKERDARLDEINRRGKELKKLLGENEAQLSEAHSCLEKANAALAAAKDVQPIEDMPEYAEKEKRLKADIDDKKQRIERHKSDFSAMLAEAEAELAKLSSEEQRLHEELSKRGIIAECERRIEELNAEARSIAADIEEAERILDTVDAFIRFKVSAVEDSINSLFGLVRFKLFDVQINGALAECCEATVNGVPYADLNTAAKINAGLDIINAISEHYGISAPVFIDNAESIVELIGAKSQVIRFVVSEADERIRVA